MERSDYDFFAGIHQGGRIAYGILCLEKVLTEKFPERDWTPVSKLLWGFSDGTMFWDHWNDKFIDIQPECLMEFSTYEEHVEDGLNISEDEYETFRSLLGDLTPAYDDFFDDVGEIMGSYIYSGANDEGPDSIEAIGTVLDDMKKLGVEPPDRNAVSSLKREKGNFNGETFDGFALSLVLNHDDDCGECPECGAKIRSFVKGSCLVLTCTRCSWGAATTHIDPIWEDEAEYSVFLELNGKKPDARQYRAISAATMMNYLSAHELIQSPEIPAIKNKASEVRRLVAHLIEADVPFRIEPEFPYKLMEKSQ